jgi:hypothetical protein
MVEEVSLSQSVNHLGFLNSLLRNLMGFAALANELTQNADDAGAEWLRFNITGDALIVENSSTFSECEAVIAQRCALKSDDGGFCDFHRFRDIASGNKRKDSDTIGAFGIGFTSVYQITDRPEVISKERHWLVFPDAPENDRIRQKRHEKLNFTRFVLPWARDPETDLRKALEVDAVSKENIDQFVRDLSNEISHSIMFLKNVRKIEIIRDGKSIKEVNIERNDKELVITESEASRRWLLLKGDFADEALDLINFHKIKRKTEVTIALASDDSKINGLLFAYLPTQYSIGMPFHINADFFPTNERKRIIFESDYQSAWNRLAIKKAAQTLTENLPDLRETLGGRGFWSLIGKVKSVAKNAETGQPDKSFSLFWENIRKSLPGFACIYTSKDEWVYPSSAFLLQDYKSEKQAIPVLEEVGLSIVHKTLDSYRSILGKAELAVPLFNLTDLTKSFYNRGLYKRISIGEAPDYLRSKEKHQILAAEIKYLLEKADDKEGIERLKKCSIARSAVGDFAPLETLFNAPKDVREIFAPLRFDSYFLADDNPAALVDLAEIFSVERAIRLLHTHSDTQILPTCFNENRKGFIKLVKWLVDNARNASDETKAELRKLKIFPSKNGLSPLDKLVIPGGFEDDLNLSFNVDLKVLQISPESLIDIGGRRLTFRTYVTEQLPVALRGYIAPEHCEFLVKLFASKLAEISNDEDVRRLMSSFSIIKCQDGTYRSARSVYFMSEENARLLQKNVHFIDPIIKYPHHIQALFKWLGASEKPKISDLINIIDKTVIGYPNNDTRELIQSIFVHLGARLSELNASPELSSLRHKKWLPAEKDAFTWYAPNQIYTPVRRSLFDSTGKFFDIATKRAEETSAFADYLGMLREPSVDLVIGHLLYLVENQKPASNAIYTFLNINSHTPSVQKLCGTNCIRINNNQYVSADKVFWSDHSFGSYRFRLVTELAQFKRLFDVLGVKDKPDYSDTIAVLKEISDMFSPENLTLDQESRKVVRSCWRILNDAPVEELKKLRRLPVVLTKSGRLDAPVNLYFDDFPGIAEELGIAQHALDRPAEKWQGLHHAGLRFLSEVVESDLIEAVETSEDPVLTRKVRNGIEFIKSIVEANKRDHYFEYRISHLKEIRIFKCRKLLIQHKISGTDRLMESGVIAAQAFYDSEKKALFYQESDLSINSISREITRSITSQTETGPIASGIKEVLSAKSLKEAARNLNELGFAKIDLSEIERADASIVSALGEMETEDAGSPEREKDFPGEDSIPVNRENKSLEFEERQDQRDEPKEDLPRKFGANINREPQAEHKETSNYIAPPRLSNPEQQQDSKPSSSQNLREKSVPPRNRSNGGKSIGTSLSASENARQKNRPRANGRWLSYPENADSENSNSEENKEKNERRRRTDSAGMKRVVESEQDNGRFPVPMQPNFKGYDIQSKNSKGNVLRYIEVKSTAGEWGTYGVSLSKSQFEENLRKGDQFWLYVVEFAEQPNAKIYRIQNPAAHVTNYCFDKGWKHLAIK